MPRSSSSPRPSSRTPSRSSSTTTTSSKPFSSVVPYTSSSVPAVVQAKPPTFLQSMKEGFGLGVGVSIARNIVDRAFGSASAAPVAVSAPNQLTPSPYDTKLYEQCIQNGATEEFCRHIAAANGIKSDSETK